MRVDMWKQLGVLAGILAVLLTVHATLVVPAILSAADDMIDQAIDRHAGTVHSRAITDREFKTLLELIKINSQKIDRLLERVK